MTTSASTYVPIVVIVAALAILALGQVATRGDLGADAPLADDVARGAPPTVEAIEPRQAMVRSRSGSAASTGPLVRTEEVDVEPPRPKIDGVLVGVTVPRIGDAWIVEACRLTSTRSAVLERRRAFATPDTGAFSFADLEPGTWQLAVVAPVFAWGPLVDAGAVRSGPISVLVDASGAIELSGIAPAARRVELIAVRSPALRGAAVRLQVPVNGTPEADSGSAGSWHVAGLSSGEYEILVHGDAGEPPSRTPIEIGNGPAAVDLRAVQPGSAQQATATGKPVPW